MLDKSECVVSVAIFIPFGREYICKVCIDACLEYTIYALSSVATFHPFNVNHVLNLKRKCCPNLLFALLLPSEAWNRYAIHLHLLHFSHIIQIHP